MTDKMDGLFGTSDAPDACRTCGHDWAQSERVHTGDDKGIGGYEDWVYCAHCRTDLFYPAVHRPPLAAAAA